MATVYIPKPGEVEGTIRPGEPLPRPWVRLNNNKTMTYKEWMDAGEPA